MNEKIHIIISLGAAIIVTIISIIQKIDISLVCIRLIFTIILFYFLGIIVRNKLNNLLQENLYEGLEIYNANIEQEETSNEEQEQQN